MVEPHKTKQKSDPVSHPSVTHLVSHYCKVPRPWRDAPATGCSLHRRALRLLRRVMSDLCGDGALALLLLLLLLPPPLLSCCELSRQCGAVMGAQSACVLRVTAGAANKQQTGYAGTIVTAVLERHSHPQPHPHTAQKKKRKEVLGGNKRAREKAGARMHITVDPLRWTLDPIT